MSSIFRRLLKPFLLLSLLSLLVYPGEARANELALGRNAPPGVTKIPIHGLTQLNGISIGDLYKMRSAVVNRYPRLLYDTYEPNDAIFGMCESSKPWWGIIGMEAYGPGGHAIDGVAKESNYIFNPYRLVSAELSNQVSRGGRTELQPTWNPHALTPQDRADPSFPYVWSSGPVLFNAQQASAQVTYDVTAYNQHVMRLKNRLQRQSPIRTFSIIAYNARDFGFHYIYLDQKKSISIRPWSTLKPVELSQFLHCGGSCGYPGGCNNMSPYIPELEENLLLALPARAYFKLWKEEPRSVESPADFYFVIDFK